MLRQGTRAQVMHGTALKTTGGLRRNHLKYNKQGKIVSKLLSTKAKKDKRLERAGWTVRKGEFGAVQMTGGFELGTEVKEKYKESPTKFKKHPVTPIPESLITKFKLDDSMWKSDEKYGRKVNWYGVRKILREVLNWYGIDETSIPDNLSTRSMVMWLGLKKDEYKTFLKTDSVKRIIDHNYKYIELAEKNFKQAGNNFSKIRGAKTKTKEDVELQTLWLLAAGMNVNTDTNSSTRASLNKNLFKINLPNPKLLDGPLLGNRLKRSPRPRSSPSTKRSPRLNAAAKAKEKKVIANARKRGKAKGKEAAERLRNKRVKQKQKKLQNPGWGNENVGYKTKN